MEEIIEIVLEGVIGASSFQGYYEACNTNLSLAALMKSAKKNFPSFACEDLKRKYSMPSSSNKKMKFSEDKENLDLLINLNSKTPQIVQLTKLLKPQTCCICSSALKSDIKRLMCHHTVHSSCLQQYFRLNSGCPQCKIPSKASLTTN